MLNCWCITWPVGFKRLSTLTGKSAHCGEEPMILQTIRYNHINLLGPYLLHASGSFDVELKEGKNTVRLAAPSGTAKCLTVCILRESYITYLLNCAHSDSFAKNNFYWPQRVSLGIAGANSCSETCYGLCTVAVWQQSSNCTIHSGCESGRWITGNESLLTVFYTDKSFLSGTFASDLRIYNCCLQFPF